MAKEPIVARDVMKIDPRGYRREAQLLNPNSVIIRLVE
jgi:hypothetical protein